jgi:hypothetical protein
VKKSLSDIPLVRIRGILVIVDADLARLYGVETRALNQAVRRNIERFPEDFIIQLSEEEKQEVITSCDHLRNLRFSKSYPYAFTEHGALMASNILSSKMSVFIIRAFIAHREMLAANSTILRRLAEIDKTLLIHDRSLREMYQKLVPLLQPQPTPSRKELGFHVKDSVDRSPSKGRKQNKLKS